MEVHHHSHTSRKKWTHYFWEFLMLFLAVFCGFLAENQREHYIEHKRARQYAQMLKEDLLADTLQIADLAKIKDTLLLAQKVFTSIYKTPLDRLTVAHLDSLSNPGVDVTAFTWQNVTYFQLKSSGNLRLFSDKTLIRKIALYEYYIKNFEFFQRSIENAVQSDYFFRAKLNRDDFFANNSSIDESSPLKQANYNFEAWKESGALNKKIISYQLILHGFYPKLKTMAIEIIELLNKEYHLE